MIKKKQKNSLKHLSIKNFRGSIEEFILEFESKKLTVIYGENGTGKSTICDAFELIGKGKVGSIERRGLGNATHKYWASVGKKPDDICITLKSSSQTCTAKVNKNQVCLTPGASKPIVEILRRSQILSLIEAKPADRYKEIKRFIDVSEIEDSESQLSRLIKNLKIDLDTAVARIDENLQTIENFHSTSQVSDKPPLDWAKEEVSRDFSAFETSLKIVRELHNALVDLSKQPKRLQEAHSNVKNAEVFLKKAKQEVTEALSKVTANADDLLNLLKSAQEFFKQHSSVSECPLCGSAKYAEGLADRTADKITQMSALDTVLKKQEKAEEDYKKSDFRKTNIQNEIQKAIADFHDLCKQASSIEDIVIPDTKTLDQNGNLSDWLESNTKFLNNWKQLELKLQERKQFISALKKSLNNYEENLKKQKELDFIIPKLSETLKIMEEERRKFTDETLSSIAEEVGKLYESIHPGEGLNKIGLQLDPKKRSSLAIDTNFCGSSRVPPQAYFSESHLDTLGLCIFLALAKQDRPENIILVLDDVLASIDEPHVERLINMICEQAQHFQHCVITTHYRPWKHKLRWGWLQSGQCHFIELSKWSTSKGLTLIKSVPEVERLRKLLAEEQPDIQSICAKAGVVLEATLDFLTQLYECKLPRRSDNRYALRELLDAIDKKLRPALKVDILIEYNSKNIPVYKTQLLKELLDEITRISQARNVFGAHFKEIAFDLSAVDALDFGNAVLKLVETLVDTEKGWPKSSKSGSYWATSGETRRLHPLRRPS